MNPALIVAAVLFLSNQGKLPFNLLPPAIGKMGIPLGKMGIPPIKDPGYFDTFRMELLLDRLRSMTTTLERVNHLNQLKGVPINRSNSIDRVQESLDAVKGLLYANKNTKHIDNLANTLSNVKQLGDMQGLMTNMGPILSMLSNKNDK
jgi:hypothetical protein